MGRLESAIQRDIILYLRGLEAAYVLNYGGSASGAKGTPDLLVCYKGRFIGLEVKRPDSNYTLTTAQQIRLRQIARAGGIGLGVESLQDVVDLIKSLEESV